MTVKSTHGGEVTVPVVIDGQGLAPTQLIAAAGGDQTVNQGAAVTLDGSGSSGNINTWQWTGPAGTTYTGADSPKLTFKAPLVAGDMTFTLKITGPNNTSDSKDVIVHVKPNNPAKAAIAPVDANVLQNLPITLDGSLSDGAARYEWSQVGGKAVNLGSANAKTETFLFPKTQTPITIQLRVRSAADTQPTGGPCAVPTCDTAQITLSPALDNLQGSPIVAKYDTSKQRWVVSGSSSILTSNNVRVHNGSSLDANGIPNGAVMGSASWSTPTGAWKIDVRGSTIAPGNPRVVSRSSPTAAVR